MTFDPESKAFAVLIEKNNVQLENDDRYCTLDRSHYLERASTLEFKDAAAHYLVIVM